MMNRLPERIHIVGASGAGKSAISRRIAATRDMPTVELDSLFWQAGWVPLATDVYTDRVRQAASGARWVMDGRHAFDQVHDIVAPRTELLIWLDPPLPVLTLRAFRRTLLRRLRNQQLWAGNVEDWRLALSAWYRGSCVPFRENRNLYERLISTHYGNAQVRRVRTARDAGRLMSWLGTRTP